MASLIFANTTTSDTETRFNSFTPGTGAPLNDSASEYSNNTSLYTSLVPSSRAPAPSSVDSVTDTDNTVVPPVNNAQESAELSERKKKDSFVEGHGQNKGEGSKGAGKRERKGRTNSLRKSFSRVMTRGRPNRTQRAERVAKGDDVGIRRL
ncbi:hypothetical protein P280DRAFT_470921 [Massarina eburnea CBS 473.64]|uniref:Uncharacterized protein n=1 Tax=Massarina eburnea CBS 473.64 TaxID=1395130 RepID=A0A6A6RUU8_9PLEO|nr:hypothetical protein P280DRAFT_470921 [Massarina eburnea CBS 473.64]